MTQSTGTASALGPSLLGRIGQVAGKYPRQFWLLLWGTLINAAGGFLVWPFMTIWLRHQLDVPLTIATLLLTLHSATGLLATTIAGPMVDRFGRKGVMVLSLGAVGATLAAMSAANTLYLWAVLMAVNGAFSPLYLVGCNSMVADLMAPARRAEAFALLRMIVNLGVAIGASLGGFLAATSHVLAFCTAAGTYAAFALLILFFVRETMPRRPEEPARRSGEGGYGPLLRDRPFLAFCGVYSLSAAAYSLFMILLPLYAKESFGLPENRYGFIAAANAAMVVLFQYAITRAAEGRPRPLVLAAGSLFYALGVGSVAYGSSFGAFLGSMIVVTVGEMILIPTASALTANMAAPTLRGRYMSVYSLAWGIGFGTGPVIGGFLSDSLAPAATWHGGATIALAAALGFAALQLSLSSPSKAGKRP